jgi:hypothetical protein
MICHPPSRTAYALQRSGRAMPRLALIFAVLAGPLVAADVPSGQQVVLHEVLVDAQDTVTYLRFRFLAPRIAAGEGQITYDLAGQDMMHLCQTVALPYLRDYALEGDRIVISFMDRITEFGQPDPDVIQFFESFRAQDDTCIWDDF